MTATPGWRVVRDWTAAYSEPFRIAAGGMLTLSGRCDRWDGHVWLWAADADGREGWIPDDLPNPDTRRARRDFDAAELTCRAGDVLADMARTHGWVRCRAEDGREGWVPRRNLAPT